MSKIGPKAGLGFYGGLQSRDAAYQASIRLAACDCSGPRSFGKFAFACLSHHHPSYNSPFLVTTPSRHCETDKMSWRNQGITGSNNIPLGKMRRFGGDGEEDGTNGTVSSNNYSNESSNGDRDVKRGRSPERMWHLPHLSLKSLY